ncbi:hypothetical protein RFI_00398 [Reticulomyxa filosa]|uniref:SNF7 family protein n=1 Tax=Reticulomyxa filosa TaxID=46433 RepID=X6PF32_RETFI|nr:hypothetical protein RFI_00398 [Reticulomyxa filosa]|eukprot:ETO36664.1 hypothetical protein RFI_00398 [Reticulomyxa filosa]
MFGRLFGQGQKKNSQPTQVDTNSAIQKLKQAIDTLEKREAHLEIKIKECAALAVQKSKKKDKRGEQPSVVKKTKKPRKKDRILDIEIKKKQLEAQVESLRGKKCNLDAQILALEETFLNHETLAAMQAGRNALDTVISETTVEEANDMIDDIAEAMEQIQEISDVMAQPLGPIVDEVYIRWCIINIIFFFFYGCENILTKKKKVDELEAELAEIEGAEMDELFSAMPPVSARTQKKDKSVTRVPSVEVPSHKIASNKTDEDELAELQAMLA